MSVRDDNEDVAEHREYIDVDASLYTRKRAVGFRVRERERVSLSACSRVGRASIDN